MHCASVSARACRKTALAALLHAGQEHEDGFVLALYLQGSRQITPLIACAIRRTGPTSPHSPAAALVADEPVAVLINSPYTDALSRRNVRVQELARGAALDGFASSRVWVQRGHLRTPRFFGQLAHSFHAQAHALPLLKPLPCVFRALPTAASQALLEVPGELCPALGAWHLVPGACPAVLQ